MRRFGFLFILTACSATSPGGVPPGEAATAAPECGPSDGCASCTSCVAQCVCMTGDALGCPTACGEPGSIPPTPPDSGGGSGGTSPAPPPESGGGSPGIGGSGGSVCTYPTGPFGTQVGSTLAPGLKWQGYRADSGQVEEISIQDYFDCDGAKGVNALLLIQAALWCGACQSEAEELNDRIASGWSAKHIAVLSLVIEDQWGSPASVAQALSWKQAFDAKGWGVVADPDFTFAANGSNGLPLVIVVDPRTMKVMKKSEGGGPSAYATLEQLATANATQ